MDSSIRGSQSTYNKPHRRSRNFPPQSNTTITSSQPSAPPFVAAAAAAAADAPAAAADAATLQSLEVLDLSDVGDAERSRLSIALVSPPIRDDDDYDYDDDRDYEDDDEDDDIEPLPLSLRGPALQSTQRPLLLRPAIGNVQYIVRSTPPPEQLAQLPQPPPHLRALSRAPSPRSAQFAVPPSPLSPLSPPPPRSRSGSFSSFVSTRSSSSSSSSSNSCCSSSASSDVCTEQNDEQDERQTPADDQELQQQQQQEQHYEPVDEFHYPTNSQKDQPQQLPVQDLGQQHPFEQEQQHQQQQQQQLDVGVCLVTGQPPPHQQQQQQHHHHIVNNGAAGGRIIVNLACIRPDLPYVIADSHHTSSPLNIVASADPIRVHYPPHATAAMTPHTNASGQSQQQATAQQQQRSTTPQQPQQQPSTASSATGGSTNATPAPPSVAAAPPPQQQQQQQQVPIYAQPPPAAVQGYGGAGVYQVVHGYMAHNAQQAPPQQQQQPPQHHYMSVNAAPFVPAEMQQQQQQQIEQIQPSSSNISHMRGGGGLRRGRVRSNGTHRREYSTRPPILPDVGLQQVTMEQQVSQHHQQQQHQQQHHHQQQQQHQHQQQQQHHHQQQQHQHQQQQQHHQANLMQSSYAPYAAATAGGYQYYYTTAAQPGHMQVGFPSAQHATGSPLYASHPGAMHMYVQSPYYPYAPTGLVYPHMFNAAEYPTAVLMDGSAVAGAKDDVSAAGDANSGGNGGSQTPQPMWHPAQVQWHPAQGLPHGAVAAGQQIITGPGGEEYVQSLDEQQQQQLQQQQQQQQHQQQQQQPQIDEYGNYAIDQPPPHMLSPIYAKDEHGGYVVHAPHHHQQQQQQQHHQHQLHQQHQHHQHLQQQQQQHHAEFIAAGGLNATAGAIHLSPQPLLDASQLPQVSQHQAAHHQQQQHQQHAHHAHPHGMHHAHPYHTLPPPQQQQQPGGHHPQHHIMMPVVMHPQDPNNGGMMLGHYVMAPPSGPPTQLVAPPPAALSEHGHLLVEQDVSDAQVVDGQAAGSVQILQQQQHENHLNNNHMVEMVEMAVDPHLHQQQQPSDGMLMVEPMSGEPVMVASGAPLVISTDVPIAGVLQAPVHGQPQHLVPSPVLFVPVQSNLPLPTPMQPAQQQQQPHYQQQQQQHQAPSVSPVSSTSSSTLSSTNVMAPTAVAVEQPAAAPVAPAAPATVHRNNPFSQPMPTNVNIKTAPLPVTPIVTPPLQSQATVISTEELDKLAKSTTEKLVIKSETRTYNNNNLQSHANNHQQQQQQQQSHTNNNNNNNNNNYHKSSNNAWTPNHPKKNTANVSVSAVPMQTSTTQTAPNVLLPTPKQPLIANAPAMRAHYDTPQSHGGKNSYGQKSDKKVWNNNNNHSHAEPAASHGHYAAKAAAAAAAVAPVPTPTATVTVASTAAPPQVQQQQQPPQHHQQQPEQRPSKQVEVNPLMLCTDAPVSATDIVVHPTVATVASTIAPQPSVVAAASNAAVPAKPEPEAIVTAPTATAAQLNVADKSTTTAAVAPTTAAPSTVRTSAAAAPVAVAPATASPPTWAGLFVNKQPAAGARVEAKRPAATPSAPSSSGKASPFDGKSEPALPHVYPLQGILASQSVAPAAVNTSTVAPATNVAAAAPLTVAASTAASTAAAPSPTPSASATAAASTTAAATPSSPAVAAPKAMSYSAASAQGLPVAAPAGKKASKAAAAAAAKPPAPSGEDASAIKLGEFFQKYTVNNAPISLRPRGLINRSNYCYMNASLQALVACPPFYNLLKSIPAQHVAALRAKATTPTIDAMIDLANEFSTLPPGSRLTVARKAGLGGHGGGKKDEVVYDLACDQPIEPTTIHKLWNSSRSEHEGRQEDAEEFLSYLLNKLNDEMLELKKLVEKPVPEANGEMAADENDDGDEWKHIDYKGHKGTVTRSTDFGNSPLSDIFRGTWRSRLQREGDTSADTLQPFFTLQLNIDKAASVREALDNFFGKDQLDGLTCSKTNQTVAAWQQMTLEKLPLVLVLHLKWFHYKIDGCTKIVKNVDFPIDLKIDSKIVSSKKYSQKQKQYRLFAVVYHDGKDASKGHYIIDAYHSGYSYWLRYDDSTVKPVSESHVLHPRQNRVPYLLYYRRSDMIGGGNSGGGGNGSAAGGGSTGSSSSASASGGNK